jgi:anaerobic selenocysteine-containing dehydrogenase
VVFSLESKIDYWGLGYDGKGLFANELVTVPRGAWQGFRFYQLSRLMKPLIRLRSQHGDILG